jgi:hypothetical protein
VWKRAPSGQATELSSAGLVFGHAVSVRRSLAAPMGQLLKSDCCCCVGGSEWLTIDGWPGTTIT